MEIDLLCTDTLKHLQGRATQREVVIQQTTPTREEHVWPNPGSRSGTSSCMNTENPTSLSCDGHGGQVSGGRTGNRRQQAGPAARGGEMPCRAGARCPPKSVLHQPTPASSCLSGAEHQPGGQRMGLAAHAPPWGMERRCCRAHQAPQGAERTGAGYV